MQGVWNRSIVASLATEAHVFRFVVLFALAGLTAPAFGSGKGWWPAHLRGPFQDPPPISRAGIPSPSLSPADFLSGCGRGRYRDPATQKCRGPADITQAARIIRLRVLKL